MSTSVSFHLCSRYSICLWFCTRSGDAAHSELMNIWYWIKPFVILFHKEHHLVQSKPFERELIIMIPRFYFILLECFDCRIDNTCLSFSVLIFFLSQRWNPAFYFANYITCFHLNKGTYFSKILNCLIWDKWNNNVLQWNGTSKMRGRRCAPSEKKGSMFVLNNNWDDSKDGSEN